MMEAIVGFLMLMLIVHLAAKFDRATKRAARSATNAAVRGVWASKEAFDRRYMPCAFGLAEHDHATTSDDCGNTVHYCPVCRGPDHD